MPNASGGECHIKYIPMLLSVIIPFKNRVSLLHRMLGSIVVPSRAEDVELILVDNNSTDASPQVACRYAARISRKHPDFSVRVMQCTEWGACAARNAGLKLARGEWAYFFDSDDELSAEFFGDMLSLLPTLSGYDMLAFGTSQVTANGQLRKRQMLFTDSVTAQLLSGHLATQNMLFRTSFLRSLGGWDDSLAKWQDWELATRALLASPRILWLRERVYHRIYVHPDSITGGSFTSTLARSQTALRAVRPQLANRPSDERLAFAAREAILSGHLLREGARDDSRSMMQQAMGDAPCGLRARLLLGILMRYTAWGGRGAWRLAMALL